MIQGMRREVVLAQAHKLGVANPHLEYRPVQLNDGSWRIRILERKPKVSTGAIVCRIANIQGQERPNSVTADYSPKSTRTKGRGKLHGYWSTQPKAKA